MAKPKVKREPGKGGRPFSAPIAKGFLGEIGREVRRLRLLRGWSIAELAERSDVRNGTVGRIETGQFPTTIDKLHRLAAALGVSGQELLSASKAWISREK